MHTRVDARVEERLRRGEPALAAVWVYGSEARGTAGPDSDLDLAILSRAPLPATLLGGTAALAAELTALAGREVDVVDLATAPPDLVRRVLAEGALWLELDRSARVAFEVRARNHWWDMEPVLRRYWAAPP